MTFAHERKRILIVEDDANSAEFLRSLLSTEGYDPVVFPSGDAVLEALAQHHPADLILLDLMMEGTDGYEVCRRIKSDLVLRFIPIIIISGRSAVEEKVLGLKLGADDYLVKPFKNKELIAKIQVLLRIKTLQDQLVHAERLAGVGQLAAGVAHEFNNLIGGMLGYAQLAMMNLEDRAMVEKALSVIENGCFRARELTENMLLFSSNHTGSSASCPLERCLDHAGLLLGGLLRKHNVQIERRFSHQQRIRIDSNRMLQVLVNLLTNAILSIAQNPEGKPRVIEVSSREENGFMLLDLADSGMGIEEAYRERVFDPFFTTRGPLGGGEGTGIGLGLSVVYGILNAHGGSISLLSSDEERTVFQVRVPLDRGEERETTEDPSPDSSEPAKGTLPQDGILAEPGKGRILVTDDEEVYRQLLSDTLRRHGYEVATAASGEEAVERCRQEAFDVIFMDYLMPGMGGIQAVTEIQRLGNKGRLVYMTGKSILDKLRESIGEGSYLYLCKPFDLAELGALIRKLGVGSNPPAS